MRENRLLEVHEMANETDNYVKDKDMKAIMLKLRKACQTEGLDVKMKKHMSN